VRMGKSERFETLKIYYGMLEIEVGEAVRM
jgi:hypothetical protein